MARILIIDDEEAVRALLRQLLERSGHEIAEAADGREGIALFRRLVRQHPVDLVITDVEMPGKSGLDVIQRLSYSFPGVKIIALTGSSGEAAQAVRVNAKTFGAYYVFPKPFPLQELLSAVEDLLNHAGPGPGVAGARP